MPVKIGLYCMNEIYNCKSIYEGVLHSSKVFPDSYVIMAFIGVVKGNGPGFSRLFERLIRGSWSLTLMEFMHPSCNTKISTMAAIVFIIDRHTDWLMISKPFVFFCVASACIYFRLSTTLLDTNDPFSPIENVVCLLLFGGIWDALARALAIDEQSQISRANNLRARALKADTLSKGSRTNIDKPSILKSKN